MSTTSAGRGARATRRPGGPHLRTPAGLPAGADREPLTRLYRGRSIEELLPRIREELGEDAVVLRRREGLAGGVGGFFQQRYVEVEAGPGALVEPVDRLDDEPALPGLLDGRAFVEELRRAGAAPVARRYAAPPAGGGGGIEPAPTPVPATAPRNPVEVRDPVEPPMTPRRAAAPEPWRPPTVGRGPAPAAGLAAPAPATAPAPASASVRPEASPGAALGGLGLTAPVAAGVDPYDRRDGAERLRAVDADVAEYGLVARGLPPLLARRLVGEAVRHALPLDPGRRLDRALRGVLSRRIPVLVDRTDTAALAVVGGPGSGRAELVVALARAHAAAEQRVLVVGLASGDGGAIGDGLANALRGAGVDVLCGTPRNVAPALEDADHDVALVDVPLADPHDPVEVADAVEALEALAIAEVHLALPATEPSARALALLDAAAPLAPDAVALTALDRAARPGAAIGAAIDRRLPLSFVATRDAAVPANAARLARVVCP